MHVLSQLNQWSGLLSVAALVLVLIVGGMAIHLQARINATNRLWRDLLGGVDAQNVEHLLLQHLEDRAKQTKEIESLRLRIHTLEGKMKTAKRYSGMHRFDAFEGVGGEQSFCMALYDDDGNGVLLTSQVGRSESRVFGKRLISGKTDRGLSVEEEAAIMEAAGKKARPQITHE